ncbi:MAG: hypothetical protein WC764_02160 [Candidatus Paceibacterota bacterium]|jgi:hypothetical protein
MKPENLFDKRILDYQVKLAIATTKEVVASYWEKTCAQRAGNSPAAAGSIYPGKSAACPSIQSPGYAGV